MSYLQDNLTSNERVLFVGKLRWTVYKWCISWGLISLVLISAGDPFRKGSPVSLFLALALVSFAVARLRVSNFVFAVTNKRVMFRGSGATSFGGVRTNSCDIPLSSIEGCELKQSFLEESTGVGVFTIVGNGGTRISIRGMTCLREAKKALFEALEFAKTEGIPEDDRSADAANVLEGSGKAIEQNSNGQAGSIEGSSSVKMGLWLLGAPLVVFLLMLAFKKDGEPLKAATVENADDSWQPLSIISAEKSKPVRMGMSTKAVRARLAPDFRYLSPIKASVGMKKRGEKGETFSGTVLGKKAKFVEFVYGKSGKLVSLNVRWEMSVGGENTQLKSVETNLSQNAGRVLRADDGRIGWNFGNKLGCFAGEWTSEIYLVCDSSGDSVELLTTQFR